MWSLLESRQASSMVIAQHAYQTRQRQAVVLLEQAGTRAQREFDDHAAAALFRRAVELARWAMMDSVPEAEDAFVRISVKLAEALSWAGDLRGAEGVLAEALPYAQGNPARLARVRLARGRRLLAVGALEEADREMRAGVGAAFKANDVALVAETYLEIAAVAMRKGNWSSAIAELAEGVMLCTGGDGPGANAGPAALWRLLAKQAEALIQVGDVPAALKAARHALSHAERTSGTVAQARVHVLLAELHDLAGKVEQASHHRRRGLELIRKVGDRKSTAELLIADARAAESSGTEDKSTRAALEQAERIAAEVGWKEGVELSRAVRRRTGDRDPSPAA
jgi:serine/threonine-protein kinase